MAIIAVTQEADGEMRVALSPDAVKKLIAAGATVRIQKDAGSRSNFSDDAFKDVGAEIVGSAKDAVEGAHALVKVGRPTANDLKLLKKGQAVIGIMDAWGDEKFVEKLAKAGLDAFAMDFMPRITRAQSMDVLSSQSNLAGYKAVIDAAALFGQAMPMMMTAAGTVPAARVFVMGAGVAGLQAIATARRLGAVVTATDVRPAAKEQVASLGAKFVAVEDEEFKAAETAAGYAKEMSDAYKKKQAELVADHVAKQDIVVTTALIPGRPAPVLITKEMVASMKPGSVIFDIAAERGGNCELTKAGETVNEHGVHIVGAVNLAADLAVNASSLYGRNVLSFLQLMLDKDTDGLAIDWDDEVIEGTALTHDGTVVHAMFQSDEAEQADSKKDAAPKSKANGAASSTKTNASSSEKADPADKESKDKKSA